MHLSWIKYTKRYGTRKFKSKKKRYNKRLCRIALSSISDKLRILSKPIHRSIRPILLLPIDDTWFWNRFEFTFIARCLSNKLLAYFDFSLYFIVYHLCAYTYHIITIATLKYLHNQTPIKANQKETEKKRSGDERKEWTIEKNKRKRKI